MPRAATLRRHTVGESDVRARISTAEKEAAAEVLKGMNLTISDAIRMMLSEVVATRSIPFKVQARVPNATTIRAMEDGREGRVYRMTSIEDLLNEPDDDE